MISISTLDTVRLQDILPSSIADDDQLAAVAGALDIQNRAIVASVKSNLPYMPNLDNQSERIVDLLAWQYHVDNYDASADLATKRDQVRQAIADHRICGTRAAVGKALDAYLGTGGHTLVEWHETAIKGAPFTYRIKIHKLPPGVHTDPALPYVPIPVSVMTSVRNILAVAANVRSWLLAYITWDELDTLAKSWDTLDAMHATWDQMDAYYSLVVA